MIFYLVMVDGYRQLFTTQVEAKKASKDFQQIDIPTDKPGLQAAIQELLTEADKTNHQQPTLLDGEMTGIPVRAIEIDDGVLLDLVPEHKLSEMTKDLLQHDPRCPKCHVVLTRTENGAKLLAFGQDMTALQEWIEYAPDWAAKGVQQAIDLRALEPNEVSDT